ncbi:MAG: LuxR C-terminal-related transcriptional regulator [Methyloprofundus sp.]|nr:LuxR C-terminal-related transcriptional regulator [Methyloprofundus sp.]
MHISLVSPAIESLLYADLVRRLPDITLYKLTSLAEFLNKNKQLDLVLFDAALGMENIAQQIRLYQAKQQAIKWVVINVTDIQQSLLYLQLGASGILTKPSEETLKSCFHSIANDQLYLEADFIQVLALRKIKKTLLPFKQLTAREYDVFCMLVENYSIQEVAEQLLISTKTAFNCQTQLRKKLDISDQQGFFKLAKKHGLIN